MLLKLVAEYNNGKHSTIKMSPVQASMVRNEKQAWSNLHTGIRPISTTKPKFKTGDRVRIYKYKRKVFDKGCRPNWTEEVFTVDGI